MTQQQQEIPGYDAISLEGPSDTLQEAQGTLQVAGFLVEAVGKNSILLRHVPQTQLRNLAVVLDKYGLRVANASGDMRFVKPEKKRVRKAFKLNLRAGRWYFADNIEESFPFVLVRDVSIEKTGNNGDEDQVLDLEFYGPNHVMPIRQTVSSREAAKYGLRPATEEDFEQVDMITPTTEELVLPVQPGGHGIPDAHGLPVETPPVHVQPSSMEMMHRS